MVLENVKIFCEHELNCSAPPIASPTATPTDSIADSDAATATPTALLTIKRQATGDRLELVPPSPESHTGTTSLQVANRRRGVASTSTRKLSLLLYRPGCQWQWPVTVHDVAARAGESESHCQWHWHAQPPESSSSLASSPQAAAASLTDSPRENRHKMYGGRPK